MRECILTNGLLDIKELLVLCLLESISCVVCGVVVVGATAPLKSALDIKAAVVRCGVMGPFGGRRWQR